MPQRWSFPPSWRWLGSATPGPFVVLGDSRLPAWALETLHGSVEEAASLPWIEGGAGFRAAGASPEAVARVRLACPVTPFELEALVSRPAAILSPGAPLVVFSDPLSVFAEPEGFGPGAWRAYLRFLEGLKRLPVPAVVLDLEGEARRSGFRARLLRDARALARLGPGGLEPVYKRVARERPACASC